MAVQHRIAASVVTIAPAFSPADVAAHEAASYVRPARILQVQTPMSDDLWSALHQLPVGVPGRGKQAAAAAMLAEVA